jgi:hypothetical protein
MTVATQTMTDEQRKSVILEYLKRLDSGRDFIELFDDDAILYFPKWGLAKGIDQVRQCLTEAGSMFEAIEHHYAQFNYVFSGSDVVVVESASHGRHRDGSWRAGTPEWGPDAGATSSRSATSRFIGSSSTSTPTTPIGMSAAIPGSPTGRTWPAPSDPGK